MKYNTLLSATNFIGYPKSNGLDVQVRLDRSTLSVDAVAVISGANPVKLDKRNMVGMARMIVNIAIIPILKNQHLIKNL
jgi:hypothetical protein